MKPPTYELKTDWTHDNLMICKSCLYFSDHGEIGCESCTHPDHYWQGTHTEGPAWNGFCKQWKEDEWARY